jgi:hypothetical protein
LTAVQRAALAFLLAAVLATVGVASVAGAPKRAARSCPPGPPPRHVIPVTRPRWLSDVLVTEYYPAPERWFVGERVAVPGLPGKHSVDWLYGARGLAMEGEGVGRDGRLYHFAGPYGSPWVNRAGRRTRPCWNGDWTDGRPAWLALGWRNDRGEVTFPLVRGGWSNGRAVRIVPPVTHPRFQPGPSRTLTYWKSAAVDPELIAFGSRIFVPAYCGTPADGWLVARDTGGAIIARHIDVYRAPPRERFAGSLLRGQRIYVVPPGFKRPRSLRCPSR